MLEIQLTQGQVVLVDDCDADLMEFKWYASYEKCTDSYYAKRNIGAFKVRMHRVVLSRVLGRDLLPTEQVDHIHHDTLDNRRSELRLASASTNGMNRTKQSNNTSGYKGVTWKIDKLKWKAYIFHNNHQIHLGYFNEINKAALAYNEAAIKHFGEFAVLNEVTQ